MTRQPPFDLASLLTYERWIEHSELAFEADLPTEGYSLVLGTATLDGVDYLTNRFWMLRRDLLGDIPKDAAQHAVQLEMSAEKQPQAYTAAVGFLTAPLTGQPVWFGFHPFYADWFSAHGFTVAATEHKQRHLAALLLDGQRVGALMGFRGADNAWPIPVDARLAHAYRLLRDVLGGGEAPSLQPRDLWEAAGRLARDPRTADLDAGDG